MAVKKPIKKPIKTTPKTLGVHLCAMLMEFLGDHSNLLKSGDMTCAALMESLEGYSNYLKDGKGA